MTDYPPLTRMAEAKLGDMGWSCPNCGAMIPVPEPEPGEVSRSFVAGCACGTGCYWRVSNPRLTPSGGMTGDIPR